MKFYLKYILLGIFIGIAILGLLSLAGCADTDAQAREDYQESRMLSMTRDFKEAKNAVTVIAEALKANRFILNTLMDIEANRTEEVYLTDMDPNAPMNAFMFKMPDTWTAKHGKSNESALKYGVSAACGLSQRSLQEVRALEKRFAALETTNQLGVKAWVEHTTDDVVDPNEVKLPDDLVVRPNEVKE